MSTDALPLPELASLPDDPAVLKQLIVQLLEALRKERHDREQVEHRLHLLLKRLYGSTSEKFDPRQGVLFDPQSGAAEAAANPAAPPGGQCSASRGESFPASRPARSGADSRRGGA